jgi:hypothetical protein
MYDRNPYETDGQLDANVRVGDADREATAERLRHHHAEGRIDMDEFQKRLDLCYRAKTVGQLRELVADLPPDPQRVPRYLGRRFGPRGLIPLVPILVAILVVSVVSGHGPHGLIFLFLLFPLTRFFLWRGRRWNLRGLRTRAGWRA